MGLVEVIVRLAAVGLVLWAVNTYVPLESRIKSIMNVVVVIMVLIWLFRVFGVVDFLINPRM